MNFSILKTTSILRSIKRPIYSQSNFSTSKIQFQNGGNQQNQQNQQHQSRGDRIGYHGNKRIHNKSNSYEENQWGK